MAESTDPIATEATQRVLSAMGFHPNPYDTNSDACLFKDDDNPAYRVVLDMSRPTARRDLERHFELQGIDVDTFWATWDAIYGEG